jgi:hypothetical protein
MSERMDFWRGFTGGFLAGVVVGAFIYFSPKNIDTADVTDDDSYGGLTDSIALKRNSAESAEDPARLIPESGNLSKRDFERSGQRVM